MGSGSARVARGELCGGSIVEESGQGPVDAGEVAGEQQRPGGGVGVAPVGRPLEEAAEVDEVFFDRGASQRFAGAGAQPGLEGLNVVALEFGAAVDVGVVGGEPGAGRLADVARCV